ncbi:transcriptional regulator [Methylobacterium nodulans]|uniref:Response regulator receiver protein n=1 Tax=Methylobacterium nodulans (strain LMG 21967 / CNCM I-2342 / ORS 2060) TaxID=460265 RepID=B8IP10_METNO|nr:transcriptional regulator [Methylobacterium nodulans]ACL60328.1 response regulator receiver protein [Methylobacterium nodulans ORS 2060]
MASQEGAAMAPDARFFYRRVLLLTPDPWLRARLCGTLEELGCLVQPFACEAEALTWAQDEIADLAMIDSLSGTGHGIALAAQLRHEGVPAVFFDGFDAERGLLSAEPPRHPGLPRRTPLSEVLEACLT